MIYSKMHATFRSSLSRRVRFTLLDASFFPSLSSLFSFKLRRSFGAKFTQPFAEAGFLYVADLCHFAWNVSEALAGISNPRVRLSFAQIPIFLRLWPITARESFDRRLAIEIKCTGRLPSCFLITRFTRIIYCNWFVRIHVSLEIFTFCTWTASVPVAFFNFNEIINYIFWK